MYLNHSCIASWFNPKCWHRFRWKKFWFYYRTADCVTIKIEITFNASKILFCRHSSVVYVNVLFDLSECFCTLKSQSTYQPTCIHPNFVFIHEIIKLIRWWRFQNSCRDKYIYQASKCKLNEIRQELSDILKMPTHYKTSYVYTSKP